MLTFSMFRWDSWPEQARSAYVPWRIMGWLSICLRSGVTCVWVPSSRSVSAGIHSVSWQLVTGSTYEHVFGKVASGPAPILLRTLNRGYHAIDLLTYFIFVGTTRMHWGSAKDRIRCTRQSVLYHSYGQLRDIAELCSQKNSSPK